jgi:CheY-like chemotaxis protein
MPFRSSLAGELRRRSQALLAAEIPLPPFVRPGAHDNECRVFPTFVSRGSCDHRRIAISVLVVDDDATFRRLARLVLAAQGLVVVAEADSVAEARSTALRVKPDGALVDVELPDGDGFTLAEELTSLSWRPRVVVTSVLAANGSPAQAQRSGAQAFVPKADLARAPLAQWLGAV